MEKLELITEHKLWGVDDWLPRMFDDLEEECRQKETNAVLADALAKGKDPANMYVCTITDNKLIDYEDYNRREVVYYEQILEGLWYDMQDGIKDMVVVTNRGDFKSEVKRPIQEIVDRICNHAFETKTIGFRIDW
mgnify:FL=1